jgi:hypothetical protein
MCCERFNRQAPKRVTLLRPRRIKSLFRLLLKPIDSAANITQGIAVPPVSAFVFQEADV